MKASERTAETLNEDKRYDDYAENRDDASISEYEITAAPSDFNVMTLKDLVDRKWLRIPGFQRNYVWDLPRASKLIESLILGLPVPQIFLYERERNNNLLIDGQQRLMSIYYFLNERFPRADRREEIRRIYDEKNHIPEEVFQNKEYFRSFKLLLPEGASGKKNGLTGLTYSTMGEIYKSRLDLRPVRCFFIKQNALSDDDSAVYEIFNRLNTGGVTLHPQEIRMSMHQSGFYEMLKKINLLPRWREMVSSSVPDLHMKDIEILLRGFAMLIEGENYRPSMVKFLISFQGNARIKNQNRINTSKNCLHLFFRLHPICRRIFLSTNQTTASTSLSTKPSLHRVAEELTVDGEWSEISWMKDESKCCERIGGFRKRHSRERQIPQMLE